MLVPYTNYLLYSRRTGEWNERTERCAVAIRVWGDQAKAYRVCVLGP